MWLRLQTDYAIRALMCLAVNDGRRVMISEIADQQSISKNHLIKVIHRLAGLGFIDSQRGRSGGLWLNRPSEQINLGDLVRQFEADTVFLDCFPGGDGACRLIPHCQLKSVLAEALEAFYNILDRFTLAQITAEPAGLRTLLYFGEPA